jgi:hypothetical protein
VSRGRLTVGAALVGAAVIGVVVGIAVRGTPAPAQAKPPPVSTATVVRTDLATTVLTGGTLGYAPTSPVVNRMAGTYTALPTVGSGVGAGQALYRVDNLPVVLMTGPLPAWRSFSAGMGDGPDVGELESNLLALGDARGLFSVATDHFDAATALAIDRWQAANGYPATGQIPLGVVVFLPGPVLVGPYNVNVGQGAAPGDAPYAVTSTSRTVSAPLTPNDPTVNPGDAVSIILPSNASTPGRVTAVLPVAAGSGSGANSSSASAGASTILTVTPDDPAATGAGSGIGVQVSLTVQQVHDVLALPVSALVALAGGGYGVEVVTPAGVHRLVGVRTGVFAGGRVQVTGSAIGVGTRVVVAQ